MRQRFISSTLKLPRFQPWCACFASFSPLLAESTSTKFQTGVERFAGLGAFSGGLLAELIESLLLIHFAVFGSSDCGSIAAWLWPRPSKGSYNQQESPIAAGRCLFMLWTSEQLRHWFSASFMRSSVSWLSSLISWPYNVGRYPSVPCTSSDNEAPWPSPSHLLQAFWSLLP